MDPRIRKKNAFVLTGGILATFGFIGVIVDNVLTYQASGCGEGNLVGLFGTCFFVWKLSAAVLAIGIVLVLWGLSRYVYEDRDPRRHLQHSTLDSFLLVFLLVFTAFAAIAALVQNHRQQQQGTLFALRIGDGLYQQVFLLEAAAVLGIVILIPYLYSYSAQSMRRKHILQEVKASQNWMDADVIEPALEAPAIPIADVQAEDEQPRSEEESHHEVDESPAESESQDPATGWEEVGPDRCSATLSDGSRCLVLVDDGELCHLHAKAS